MPTIHSIVHHPQYNASTENFSSLCNDLSIARITAQDTEEDVARKINNAYCPSTSEAADEQPAEAVEAIDAGLESMHLTKDDLKNPCLDYVDNIIFSVPDATFEAGGKAYTSFADVKSDFISGKLVETVLKEGLIKAINKLLQPVRDHFASDEKAKAILAQVMAWKRENLVPPTGLKRLAVTDGTKPVHVVFAPAATAELTLGDLLTVQSQLAAAPAEHEVILWFADWGSFSLNKCGGDQKAISASFTILVEALKAASPQLMARVRVMIQSEALLANPSDYWISVINVGRKYNLQKVLDAESEAGSEYAGQVISSLMHVADCLAVAPSIICAQPCQAGLAKLCVDYYAEAEISEIKPPSVAHVPVIDSILKPPHMQEGPANADDNIFIIGEFP